MVAALLALGALMGAAAAPGWTLLDPKASYPEGPVWTEAGLFYTEMGADRISRISDGKKAVFWTEEGCGPVGLAKLGAGFIVLCHYGNELVVIDAAGRTRQRIGPDTVARAGLGAAAQLGAMIGNPNEASPDGRGGVYFSNSGVFARTARPTGKLVHLAAEGRMTVLADAIHYANGVLFLPDANAVLVSEHLRRRVLRFNLGPNGEVKERLVFADLDKIAPPARKGRAYPEAGPDGLTRLPNGDILVAMYGEGRLLQLAKTGAFRRAVETPVRYLCMAAVSPDGAQVAVVGAHENDSPPFPGAVAVIPVAAFAP